MRFFLIFILIHFGIGTALSQEAEQVTIAKVNKTIDSLKSRGISKIGFKKDYCVVGYSPFIKISEIDGHRTYPCNYYFTLYLFWQQGSNGFVKKYDACGESFELRVDSKELLDIPDRYFDTMKKEKVKMFSAWRKHGNDSTLSYSSIDHSCQNDILFLSRGDSLLVNLDSYDLSETDFDGRTNQSYAENKKLKIVEWEERLSAIIRKLEDEKKFKTSN